MCMTQSRPGDTDSSDLHGKLQNLEVLLLKEWFVFDTEVVFVYYHILYGY